MSAAVTAEKVSIAKLLAAGFIRCGVLADCEKFSQDEMRYAFERVQNPQGWKLEINCESLRVEMLVVTIAAIVHFAGSESYVKQNADGTMTIYAPGYYARVGA